MNKIYVLYGDGSESEEWKDFSQFDKSGMGEGPGFLSVQVTFKKGKRIRLIGDIFSVHHLEEYVEIKYTNGSTQDWVDVIGITYDSIPGAYLRISFIERSLVCKVEFVLRNAVVVISEQD